MVAMNLELSFIMKVANILRKELGAFLYFNSNCCSSGSWLTNLLDLFEGPLSLRPGEQGESGFWSQMDWVQISALTFPCCMTENKSGYLSKLWFSYGENENDNNNYFHGFLSELMR